METIIGRMAARLTGDSSDFSKATNQAAGSVENLDKTVARSNDGLKKHATAVDSVERAFTKLATTVAQITIVALIANMAVLTGALTAATAEAIKFESSFAGIKKTVDATPAEFDAISASIRTLSKEIPINVNELNKIGEAAGQLGVKKENLTDFIETIAKISVTTNLTADQAADAFARFSNIMQTPQDQISNLGSGVVELGNKFAGTEAEIISMAMRLAGAGHTVGMTEGDVLGLATALSSVGIEAEAGGTAFSKVFIDMADAATGNSKKARQMLQDMATVIGVSAEDLGKKIKENAAGAVLDLITSLGKLQKQGGDVTGTLETLGIEDIRMRDAILRAAGASDIFTDAVKVGNEAIKENTALNEEAAKRFETTESKITLAENAVRDMAITVGGPFRDALGDILGAFADTVKGGEDVKRVVEEFTPVIEGATEVLKPLIKGFAQDAPGAIETFGAAIITLKGYFDILSKAIDTLASKIGVLKQVGQAAGDIGGLLFGDFQRDTAALARQLRGERPLETPQQENTRTGAINAKTGMTVDQIRDASASANAPTNRHITADDFEQSGGVWVLKQDAEARLKAAQEATETYQAALEEESKAAALGATPQPTPGDEPFAGRTPESKEDRTAREKADRDAATKARQAAEKAAREAKAAADKLAREAEQAAQRHADMIASFNRTIEEGAYAIEENLGKYAQRAQKALGDVFSASSDGTEGSALAKSIGDLIKQAKDAGVPEAEELGRALVAAASNAVVTKSPEARAAAQAIIDQLNAGILEASKLTSETFGKAFDKEALAFQLGKTGAEVMDSLDKAITAGGVKNIDSLAKAVAGMRRTLVEDLDPDRAAELGGQMMELLAQAIDEKSPEAIQALEDFLRQLNMLLPLEKAGEAMAERINKAIDSAAERIREIQDSAARRIEQASEALTDSRELRKAREDVADAQRLALKEATESIETERQAYKDMRDEQHILDGRKLEDSEKVHARALEDAKALKDFEDSQKLNKQHDTSSVGGNERMERAKREGLVTGPRPDAALEARKAYEKAKKDREDARKIEDAEIERKRGIEDGLRKDRIAERVIDLDFEKQLATNLDNFKRDQTKDLRKFEDDQADGALERDKARTLAAAQLEIDKANENLTKMEADENEKFGRLQTKLESMASVTMPTIEAASTTALDPLLDDADALIARLNEAARIAAAIGGGVVNGTTGQPTNPNAGIPTGGIDDPGSVGNNQPSKPPDDPGNGGGGDPGGGGEPDPGGMADGGVVSEPTLTWVAEQGAPEAVAPLSSLQSMVNAAAYAGMQQANAQDTSSQSSTSSGPHIELHNPQFYGTGGPKAFVRQVGTGLSTDARDKQAVQGD